MKPAKPGARSDEISIDLVIIQNYIQTISDYRARIAILKLRDVLRAWLDQAER